MSESDFQRNYRLKIPKQESQFFNLFNLQTCVVKLNILTTKAFSIKTYKKHSSTVSKS